MKLENKFNDLIKCLSYFIKTIDRQQLVKEYSREPVLVTLDKTLCGVQV